MSTEKELEISIRTSREICDLLNYTVANIEYARRAIRQDDVKQLSKMLTAIISDANDALELLGGDK